MTSTPSRAPRRLLIAALLLACCLIGPPAPSADVSTFGAAGAAATQTLLHTLYAGKGLWQLCLPAVCGSGDQDWGADSLTYALALRARTSSDQTLSPVLSALATAAASYPAPCNGPSCGSWSDVPEWDAIALAREYETTRDPAFLTKAEAAFAFVEGSDVFSRGACPTIRYQQPHGGTNHLKTLETDGNAIKAALLLYRDTGRATYLADARQDYAAVRTSFLDPKVPLYTTYVFDNGHACTQLPHRFFASANGDMIWNGFELSRDTGSRTYLAQAIETARAIDTELNDSDGIFIDLQAENDIVEPLAEAMYVLAAHGHLTFARNWILRNAAAALGARTAAGTFGRFFDGPPPTTTVTAWQTNGGLALEIAAAALAPKRVAVPNDGWTGSVYISKAITGAPAHLTVDGSGIALIGTLGEQCCEPGHIRVFVDGKQTLDQTGIWQNKSSAGIAISGAVLFAWRWPQPGKHTIRFEAGIPNAKEGPSFVDLQGYFAIPR